MRLTAIVFCIINTNDGKKEKYYCLDMFPYCLTRRAPVNRHFFFIRKAAFKHFDATRPDTLYGATFMALAPEHALAKDLATEAQRAAVEEYIYQASLKSLSLCLPLPCRLPSCFRFLCRLFQ